MWEYNHTPNSDELYHYGVKGMKWGVHKSPEDLLKELKEAAEKLKTTGGTSTKKTFSLKGSIASLVNKGKKAFNSKVKTMKLKGVAKKIAKGKNSVGKILQKTQASLLASPKSKNTDLYNSPLAKSLTVKTQQKISKINDQLNVLNAKKQNSVRTMDRVDPSTTPIKKDLLRNTSLGRESAADKQLEQKLTAERDKLQKQSDYINKYQDDALRNPDKYRSSEKEDEWEARKKAAMKKKR